MRVNQGQEFVIGGYTPSSKNFDALIFGYYEGRRLLYAARTRNGFTPASRLQLYRRFRDLEVPECPFTNLPEPRDGRWGQGLTAEKMRKCRWLNPALVGQFEFVEWTPDGHLRHARFIGLREDKDPKQVRRVSRQAYDRAKETLGRERSSEQKAAVDREVSKTVRSSNRRTLNALVDLLEERGVLTKREVLERANRLRADEREGLNPLSAPSSHRKQTETITIVGPSTWSAFGTGFSLCGTVVVEPAVREKA